MASYLESESLNLRPRLLAEYTLGRGAAADSPEKAVCTVPAPVNLRYWGPDSRDPELDGRMAWLAAGSPDLAAECDHSPAYSSVCRRYNGLPAARSPPGAADRRWAGAARGADGLPLPPCSLLAGAGQRPAGSRESAAAGSRREAAETLQTVDDTAGPGRRSASVIRSWAWESHSWASAAHNSASAGRSSVSVVHSLASAVRSSASPVHSSA